MVLKIGNLNPPLLLEATVRTNTQFDKLIQLSRRSTRIYLLLEIHIQSLQKVGDQSGLIPLARSCQIPELNGKVSDRPSALMKRCEKARSLAAGNRTIEDLDHLLVEELVTATAGTPCLPSRSSPFEHTPREKREYKGDPSEVSRIRL